MDKNVPPSFEGGMAGIPEYIYIIQHFLEFYNIPSIISCVK